MSEDQFYKSKENSEDSSSDALVALVIIICCVLAATIYVSSYESRYKDLFNIKGKVAVVTGGSRGIGEMITSGFLANGVKVYITARRKKL